jgi:arylsulfatase A-like enzyme
MPKQNFSRRNFLKAVGLGAAAIIAPGFTAGHRQEIKTASGKPNIIFILTDDQRADSLGCMGNNIIKTPNIDKLAADGVLFENASVNSAICTPSRCCFFLGQYERKHGVNFNSATTMAPAAWERSYPVLLRKAGYFTGYVGKNHSPIGLGGYKSGLIEKSFDYWYAGHGQLTFYPKQRHKIFNNAKADTQVEVVEEGTMNFLESNEQFMAGAEQFLAERPKNKPFCLSVCFNLPHNAGLRTMKMLAEDPEIYKSLYRDIQMPLPSTYLAKKDIKKQKIPHVAHQPERRQKGYKYVDQPDTLRERLTRYYQAVTGIDMMIGRLRAKLADMGIADDTILIYTSDHGIMQGEFGLGGKALNYEQCLHIPMIIYDPRANQANRGKRRKELIQSIDIAPTIVSMAGLAIPASMQGEDITPLLNGQKVRWRQYAFAENLWSTVHGNPRIESVRTQHYKYIRYFKYDVPVAEDLADPHEFSKKYAARYQRYLTASILGEEPVYEELFYLAADPQEEHNLAGDDRYADKLAEMRDKCRQMVKQAKGDMGRPLTLPAYSDKAYSMIVRQD